MLVHPYPYYRQENWDSTLRLYYDAFNATLRAMSVEGADVTYEEFLLDVKASIPISLFFCGNIQGYQLTLLTSNGCCKLILVATCKLQERVVLLYLWII